MRPAGPRFTLGISKSYQSNTQHGLDPCLVTLVNEVRSPKPTVPLSGMVLKNMIVITLGPFDSATAGYLEPLLGTGLCFHLNLGHYR